MNRHMIKVSGNEEDGWGIDFINRYKNTKKIIVGNCSNLRDSLKFCKGLKKILGEMPIIKEEIEKCKNCDGDGNYPHVRYNRVRVPCPVCDAKGWIEKGTKANYKMK